MKKIIVICTVVGATAVMAFIGSGQREAPRQIAEQDAEDMVHCDVNDPAGIVRAGDGSPDAC
jgi:hypothetical protein